MVGHTDELSGHDPIQVALMAEECILLDQDDRVIGHDSKKACHLNTNIRKGILHRAFSVFLFDSQGRLLLQQRSADKITFPLTWTNTCCSHPLYFPDELVEEGELGVRRAAQRKLEQELGIPPSELPLDAFQCVSRIHYLAESDETWGEHEIDYILIVQKDVTVVPNPNEVASVQYVSLAELKKLIQDPNTKLTPWFRLMTTGGIDAKSSKEEGLLDKWWGALSHIQDMRDMTIQRFL
jgi:isopentenyl-diphosphate delta-isomerase